MNMVNNNKRRRYRLTNNLCDAYAFLLALLSKSCSIKVSKPRHKTMITHEFIKISEIVFGNGDGIDVSAFVKLREEELVNDFVKKGLQEQRAKRRMQDQRRLECFHLVIDILSEKNIFVSCEIEENAGIDGKINIFQDQQLVYSNESIKKYGPFVTDYIQNKLGTMKTVLFNVGELYRLLN
ncbi:hypothetical protein ENUP19_0163G0012 [Entamoeba nuttalli]|uniref:Uncharacterized protein n=2 Tax=Entamoeba nuttalli TaxID=412467 RepID=K2HHD6_ENTNP|nr:hypothetical protein ENU1_023770 [Entamoeba nuttalli P19]EKE42359.1 hypothetical protein ENU1_023770 [Entamoeba nuttalli P19]|eukprot:XP_008855308.1 hypothetical protein ENU1_023770 [Entamoeba nuttalli P19]